MDDHHDRLIVENGFYAEAVDDLHTASSRSDCRGTDKLLKTAQATAILALTLEVAKAVHALRRIANTQGR